MLICANIILYYAIFIPLNISMLANVNNNSGVSGYLSVFLYSHEIIIFMRKQFGTPV